MCMCMCVRTYVLVLAINPANRVSQGQFITSGFKKCKIYITFITVTPIVWEKYRHAVFSLLAHAIKVRFRGLYLLSHYLIPTC
jgi:hypothetical protein